MVRIQPCCGFVLVILNLAQGDRRGHFSTWSPFGLSLSKPIPPESPPPNVRPATGPAKRGQWQGGMNTAS